MTDETQLFCHFARLRCRSEKVGKEPNYSSVFEHTRPFCEVGRLLVAGMFWLTHHLPSGPVLPTNRH